MFLHQFRQLTLKLFLVHHSRRDPHTGKRGFISCLDATMNVSDTPGATEFWRWSIACYDRPGIAAFCLDLQDRQGRDVNLALLLLFLADQGFRPLTAAEIGAIDRAATPFRQWALLPARARRRALKAAGGPNYEAAKAAELDLERESQRQMLAAVPPLGRDSRPAAEIAALSLAAYGVTEAGALLAALG
ncbi:MAG: TIGR02444 family protein [Zavarzinia sp.]